MGCEEGGPGPLVSVCTEEPASQGQEELDPLPKTRQEQRIMGQGSKEERRG